MVRMINRTKAPISLRAKVKTEKGEATKTIVFGASLDEGVPGAAQPTVELSDKDYAPFKSILKGYAAKGHIQVIEGLRD